MIKFAELIQNYLFINNVNAFQAFQTFLAPNIIHKAHPFQITNFPKAFKCKN